MGASKESFAPFLGVLSFLVPQDEVAAFLAAVEKLRGQHPIIDDLLSYREFEKLRGTYGEGLIAEVAPDGRIHATFNQTVARTGRLSSDAPNLHNIPVRSDEGRQFRRAFVPRAGCELLVADYNQIELRCIAHLAGDPGLIEAFRSGTDIHTATASRVFGVEADQVTIEQRSKAKMVSYGLAYGMEAFGLGQRLAIRSEDEGDRLRHAGSGAGESGRYRVPYGSVKGRCGKQLGNLFGCRRGRLIHHHDRDPVPDRIDEAARRADQAVGRRGVTKCTMTTRAGEDGTEGLGNHRDSFGRV